MKKNLLKLCLAGVLLIAISATCTKETPVSHITINKTSLILAVGETESLTVTVHPENAMNTNIIWTTDNNKVITVENGTVTAISEGMAKITATTEDGNHTATCDVQIIHTGESVMIMVEGGTFTMGCTDDENPTHTVYERPAHQVTVFSFQIAKYPVTQKQWKAIMDNNPSHFKGDNLPVENVSWHDAQTFISRLNEITGKKYRLPTEAEWEYACRGGVNSAQYKYSGNNNLDLVGWYIFNSENMTQQVGKMAFNELKINDMSGNVWEWCQDWASEYDDQPQTNPQGPVTGACRIARGGSYHSDYLLCRVSYRSGIDPYEHNSEIGFRIVLP